MSSNANDPDQLLARLRQRAADPERRTSVRPSQFTAQTRTMDLGGLLSMLGGVAGDLNRVVSANQSGRVDAAGLARAQEFQAAMSTPVSSDLPAPASKETLADAEAALGAPLPAFLRRVYTEIADGGLGPGEGLLTLERAATALRRLRTGGELPRGRHWPEGVIPIVAQNPGYLCVEAATGRVLDWDPEDLAERSSEARFQRSFSEEAPSVEAWLDAWVGSRTQAEIQAESMRRYQIDTARKARAEIARMSPEQRAAMGLPEVGWERVVWGGIGLDEDDDPPA